MIEFVFTSLPVRIAQQGYQGNHAFLHAVSDQVMYCVQTEVSFKIGIK